MSVVVEEESRSVSLYYNGQIKKGWGGVGCGVGLGWVGFHDEVKARWASFGFLPCTKVCNGKCLKGIIAAQGGFLILNGVQVSLLKLQHCLFYLLFKSPLAVPLSS